jgi:GTPase SAR1 family protein
MHVLIVGATGMGKTLYCKALSRQYFQAGKPALVLTPFGNNPKERAEWRAETITTNLETFLNQCARTYNRPVFIDEMWRYGDDKRIVELATMGRHNGLVCHFIGQRQMHVDINIRTNCSVLVMFKQSDYDCEVLYRDFVDPAIRAGDKLERFQAIIKQSGQPAIKRDIRPDLGIMLNK